MAGKSVSNQSVLCQRKGCSVRARKRKHPCARHTRRALRRKPIQAEPRRPRQAGHALPRRGRLGPSAEVKMATAAPQTEALKSAVEDDDFVEFEVEGAAAPGASARR